MAKKINLYTVGTKVRVLVSNSYIPVGTEATIIAHSHDQVQLDAYPMNWIPLNHLEIIPSSLSKEDVEKKMTKAEADLEEGQRMLDYLKEFDVDVVDMNEYKVFNALRAIDNDKLTEKERIKLIAKLID